MTKDQLQKELQEKIKEGIKPSHLRKSKSLDNIPAALPLPKAPLQKSKSQLEIPTQQSELVQLQDQIKFHAQTAQNYLQSLQTSQAKVSELEENTEKDQQKITNLEDQILQLRLDKIKEFANYLEKKQDLETELELNISEGLQEIKKLENKLIATNKKKLELQQKLSQEQLKNTQLELKLISSEETNPSYFNYWPLLVGIGLLLIVWLLSIK